MSLVSTPTNISALFIINSHDGSLTPTALDVLGSRQGAAALGPLTIAVVNNFTSDSAGVIAALIISNGAIPLPFGRYVVDYAALKVAAASAKTLALNTF